MKLNEAIAKSIKRYPLLYRDLDYQKSRIKVLGHYFFTLGNGMAWWDGYLTDHCEMEYRSGKGGWVGTGGKKYGEETYKGKFSKDYFTSNKIVGPEDKQRHSFRKSMKLPPVTNEFSRYPWTPYPVSDVLEPFHKYFVPDNIQNDWLEGANEIVQYALQFWADEKFYCADHYYQDIGYPVDYKKPNGKKYSKKGFQKYRTQQIEILTRTQKRVDSLLKKRGITKKIYKLPIWEEKYYHDSFVE